MMSMATLEADAKQEVADQGQERGDAGEIREQQAHTAAYVVFFVLISYRIYRSSGLRNDKRCVAGCRYQWIWNWWERRRCAVFSESNRGKSGEKWPWLVGGPKSIKRKSVVKWHSSPSTFSKSSAICRDLICIGSFKSHATSFTNTQQLHYNPFIICFHLMFNNIDILQ